MSMQTRDRAKRFLSRSVAGALERMPPAQRSQVVSVLPRRVLPSVIRGGRTQDRRYWDARFAQGDPWGIDHRPEERLKYERTLALCGKGPFDRALEIGCAMGAFTEVLAPRCESLLAVDISDVAVRRARERVAASPRVRCEAKALPAEYPPGRFDLVVASDVLLYWRIVDVQTVLRAIEDSLRPGGVFVAVNYVPPIGAILDGTAVHECLRQATRLSVELSEVREFAPNRPWELGRFVKPQQEAHARGPIPSPNVLSA